METLSEKLGPWAWLVTICLAASITEPLLQVVGPHFGGVYGGCVFLLGSVLIGCIGSHLRCWQVTLGGTPVMIASMHLVDFLTTQKVAPPPSLVPTAKELILLLFFGSGLFAVSIASHFWHRRWLRKRFPSAHCPKCGYNLKGLTEPRCPECGVPFDEKLLKAES